MSLQHWTASLVRTVGHGVLEPDHDGVLLDLAGDVADVLVPEVAGSALQPHLHQLPLLLNIRVPVVIVVVL